MLIAILSALCLTGCGSDDDYDRAATDDGAGSPGPDNGDGGGGDTGDDNTGDDDTAGDDNGGDTDNNASADPNLTAFAKYVHPLTSTHCIACHQSSIAPFHAHSDVNTAFQAVTLNQLVNLNNPDASRLVNRLRDDKHQCWDGSCADSAMEMLTAIQNWADEVAGSGGENYNILDLSTANAAFELSGSTRDNGGVIALYDFSAGSGTTIFDRSNLEPLIDLTLSNGEWLGSGGVIFGENSSAIADAESSGKLFDMIAGDEGSQAYSIEAWVVPASTDQNGPARIVSYSDGTRNRNFTMGQDDTYYNFRNRNAGGDVNNNGTPALENNVDDQVTTNLQHLVMTYDAEVGRRIYVDTQKVDAEDPAAAADLSNWDEDYRLVFANETTANRDWRGQMLWVAIYNKALTQTQIDTNFKAGVGEKFLVKFDISNLVETPDTYIQFEAAEFDDYSYLFANPTLIAEQSLNDLPLKNMYLVINDNVPVAGQSYKTLDVELKENGQQLSPVGTIVARDKGVEEDRFKLAFEVAGASENVYVETTPQAPPVVDDGEPATDINGVRTFDQIYHTLATITGINPNDNRVRNIYRDLKTQFPTSANMASFVSGHQVAIDKLSLEFCDRLVENNNYRNDFFGNGFQFNSGVGQAFAGSAETALIVDAFWNHVVGAEMERQPGEEDFKTEVAALIDELISHAPEGNATRTRSIVKGACLAVLASSTITVH